MYLFLFLLSINILLILNIINKYHKFYVQEKKLLMKEYKHTNRYTYYYNEKLF